MSMTLQLTKKLHSALLKEIPFGLLVPAVHHQNYENVRHRRAKHWDPKWKLLRKLKIMKVELPEYDKDPSKLSKEEIRSKMKEKGILPPRPWIERPTYISCTGTVFESYVPPEGDGKVSLISSSGAKQNMELLGKKTKSMMAIRKIRSFDDDFETYDFCKLAVEIYQKAHECLVAKDKYQLRECVTEKAYPELMYNTKNKTIHWKYLKDIEPQRVVHARCTDIITKENVFAQLTVRFHTQQTLAIYDRFGRLMYGSEILAKDVLEYVVFEKHLANEYGTWKIHAKIIPDWLPPKEPSLHTYKKITEGVSEDKVIVEETPKIEEKTSSALVEPSVSSEPPKISA